MKRRTFLGSCAAAAVSVVPISDAEACAFRRRRCRPSGGPISSRELSLNQDTIPQGPARANQQYHRINNEDYLFATFISDEESSNSRLFQEIADQYPLFGNTHIWDDLWYYSTVPVNKSLVMYFVNIQQQRECCAVINNYPGSWEIAVVVPSGQRDYVLRNGHQFKASYYLDGQPKIDFDIYNPNNSGDWGPSDIWYSFGFGSPRGTLVLETNPLPRDAKKNKV